jgi:hypothetical protein
MQSALAAVQHYTAGYDAFRDMVVTNRCVCCTLYQAEFGVCNHVMTL